MKCECEHCGHKYAATPEPTHRVICGDSRDPVAWGALCGRERVAIVVTSPPYASQRVYDESSGFKPIRPEDYTEWWEALQACVAQYLAEDGSFFVNIKEHCDEGQRSLYVKDLVLAHVRKWGWLFVDELCWLRAGVPGGWPNRFKNGWEPVFHFTRQDAIKFRPENVSHETEHAFDYSPDNGKAASGSGLLGKEHAAGFHEGLARPSNVLEIGSGGAKVTGDHPAEYPVGLPEFFIRAFTDEGDLVADPFGGAGTTLIAAAKHNRRARIIEISARYTDVVRKRFTAWAKSEGLEAGPGGLE